MGDLEERLLETCHRLERELGVPVSLSTSNEPGEGEVCLLLGAVWCSSK